MRHNISRTASADLGTLPLFDPFAEAAGHDVIDIPPLCAANDANADLTAVSPGCDDTDELPPFDFGDDFEPLDDAVALLAEALLPLDDEVDEDCPISGAAIASPAPARNRNNYAQSSAVIPSGGRSAEARLQANLSALAMRKVILAEARPASDDEKAVLAAFSGWGGLAAAFLPTTSHRKKLEALLSEEELEAARAGMLTQHFTPDWVIDLVYQALMRMGVKPKRLLEPACGNGLFIGRIPAEWKDTVAVHAAEIDPILASITQLLHPDATVHSKAFEKLRLPNDAFDAVITNVPFGESKPFDEETPALKLALHNFFISKALRKVRPGGVVAVITSAFTMDAKGDSVRKLIARQADLVAAARLPSWAFLGTANTEVSADLLILRKRLPDEMVPLDPAWTRSAFSENAWVNQALIDNSEAWCLGGHQVVSGKYGNRHIARAQKADIDDHTRRWLEQLAEGTCQTPQPSQAETARIGEQLELQHLRGLRFGAFAVHRGAIVQIDARGNPQMLREMAKGTAERVHAYIGVRDALKRLLLLQSQSTDEAAYKSARYELNCRYDAFVGDYKALNTRYNRSVLRRDPDFPLVSSLEVYDEELQIAEKAVIFRERTVRPREKVTRASNPVEALAVSLNYGTQLDMHKIGSMCGLSEYQAAEQLQSQGRVYLDPESQSWQLSEVYLSGNIQHKLEAARLAAEEDKRFEVNVGALQAALPVRIPYGDIAIQLGSTFVRSDHIVAFVDHLMDNTGAAIRAAEVEHTPTLAKWRVKASGIDYGNNKTRWGTSRVSGTQLVEMSLNMKSPTIRDCVETKDGPKYVVNADATLAAREKQMLVQEEFKTWIWRDATRAMEIEEVYNRTFNTTRPFVADGGHLVLPGLSEAIQLRASQKNGIWRNMIGGNTLIGHAVGAGKTLIGICTAMEMKRLGLRRCSIIATPNHIVGQFAREFLSAYPCANLLVIESEDANRENREFLLGRLATGNYDAVIMAHSTFGAFGVSSQQLDGVARDWYDSLAAAEASATDRTALKDLERRRKALDAFVERMEADARKCPLTFDQLGCDQLIVDESQAFKNLWYTTSMERISGLPAAFSRRAFDMFVKVRAVAGVHQERGGVVFMSATPIANTVAEMYHLMRYMIMPVLVQKGIDQFDAWAANFGRTVVNIETTPDGGGFRLQTRFARFENLPELMALFGSFADIQTKEDLNLPTPKIAGEKPQVVSVPPSQALKSYIRTLVKRAEAIRSPNPETRPHPSEDNMLAVTSDGRMAALDMRLVGGKDDPGSKLNVAIANIARIWKETGEKKLTQLVFCDLGTPGNTRCDIYQDIKDKLVKQGVMAREIAFVHDFDSVSKLALLQARMNRGDIRILIASTEKAGTGFNVQRLLYAEHELDCPWRPDQVEQRGGRIERQGNLNPVVLMFRYVTEGSFDAYNWNLIEQKMRFILQVMTSKCTVRSAEDIEVRALTVAEVKALATGNPRIIERALLQQKESKLEALSRNFYRENTYARHRAAFEASEITKLQGDMDRVQKDVITAAASTAEAPMRIGGRSYTAEQTAEAGEALESAFADAAAQAAKLWLDGKSHQTAFEIGGYRGFKLGISAGLNQFSGITRYEWCVEGQLRWGTELGPDRRGNVVRIRNLVERLPQELAKRKLRLEQAQKALADIEASDQMIFPQAAELVQVRDQLRRLDEELGIVELDAQATGVEADDSDAKAEVLAS